MAGPNIYNYDNYREFLADWLKANGYTYRSFAERYGDIVSFIAVAKTLSKGKSGQRPQGQYRMSAETLARLGKAMRLTDAELRHLVLLKLENDADRLPGTGGGAYQQAMRHLVAENRNLVAEIDDEKAGVKHRSGSESGRLLVDFFELLPTRFRTRILEEIILQGRVYASRQSGKAGVKAVRTLLQRLEEVRDMGAP